MEKEGEKVKLKTRIYVTFISIVLIPLFLIPIAFYLIGAYILITGKKMGADMHGMLPPIELLGKVEAFASATFLVYMIIAIAAILFFTSFALTKWIQKGVLDPVTKLNKGLQKVAEGNFEYRLNPTE